MIIGNKKREFSKSLRFFIFISCVSLYFLLNPFYDQEIVDNKIYNIRNLYTNVIDISAIAIAVLSLYITLRSPDPLIIVHTFPENAFRYKDINCILVEEKKEKSTIFTSIGMLSVSTDKLEEVTPLYYFLNFSQELKAHATKGEQPKKIYSFFASEKIIEREEEYENEN